MSDGIEDRLAAARERKEADAALHEARRKNVNGVMDGLSRETPMAVIGDLVRRLGEMAREFNMMPQIYQVSSRTGIPVDALRREVERLSAA